MNFAAAGFVMSGGVDGEDGTVRGGQVDEGQILWNNRAVSVFILKLNGGESLTCEKWREIREKMAGLNSADIFTNL